jgi:hypothetical protein
MRRIVLTVIGFSAGLGTGFMFPAHGATPFGF